MPNRRMIHASIWQDEDIAGLTDRQQLLFIGLFSNADDQGRLQGHPMLIRSLVFPYRDISSEDMLADLDAIGMAAAVLHYEIDGKAYVQLTEWWEYQQLQWAKPSLLPAPDGWTDRIRVRKGKGVRVENWPSLDDNPNATPKETPVETPVTTPEPITITATEQQHNDNENDNENLTATASQPKRAKPPPRAAAAVPGNALQEMLDLGIDATTARKLELKHPTSFILGWCAIAQERDNLSNPAGLVIAMLRDGIEPPELPEHNDDWYTRKEYEQHIAAAEGG